MLWILLSCQASSIMDTSIKNIQDDTGVDIPNLDDTNPEENVDDVIISEPSGCIESEEREEDVLEQQIVSGLIHKATHNSYTGHDKGSIIEQRNAGVRSLGYDIHDNDYISLQSYQIGHSQVGSGVELGNGQAPTIVFVDLNGNQLQEIHNSASTLLNWDWDVTLHSSDGTLSWNGNSQTSDIKFEKSVSQTTNYSIEVWVGADKNAPLDTLLYSTYSILQERIRYPQIIHVELQKNDSSELEDDETVFGATGSGDFLTITLWNSRGYLSRMWEFNSSHVGNEIMTFPATDEPMANWYQEYMNGMSALE